MLLQLTYNIKKHTIMVVLGCAIEEIQEDRVNAALKYVKEENQEKEITWYLTGGVKNAINRNNEKTEASKMSAKITNQNILLDELATNTAENFLYLREKLKTPQYYNSEIVITTSEFHKERAEQIFEGIFESTTYEAKWNLSSKACPTCWNDELIHMRNVRNDVHRALLIVQ